MNSFFGLTVGLKGLTASQAALNTINHNISNAGTTGYSRQVVAQKASRALAAANGAGMVGTGVDITTIVQIRNVFLDRRYWQENAQYGEWQVKSSSLSELQSLLSSSSTDGLDDALSSFVSALEDLAGDPSDDSARSSVKAEAEAFCTYLNNMASTLEDLRSEANSAVKTKVDEINSLAGRISALNQQIYKAELTGGTANDLRDQRTVLVDQLSEIASIEVSETAVGTLADGQEDLRFSIKINGVSLVNHFSVKKLECSAISDGSASDGLYEVRWAETGNEVTFTGGEIKGDLDMAGGDGQDGAFKGIPYYLGQLNTFAQTLAKAFNEGVYADGETYGSGHAGGVGLDDGTGIRFFSYDGLSSEELMAGGTDLASIYGKITAANISLSAEVENDPGQIAASSVSGETENSANLTELIAMFSDSGVFANGSPEEFINAIYTTIGVETSLAGRISTLHENIAAQIDTNRTAVAGVSLDEETSNLIKYQLAYNAAAKVMSVMDEVLDVTINSLFAD
ncbi:flagellar hook-associated protein FlgK [Syntrophobotulus glycolicus DSM 8271]|uniref:Flagellar hook-associated protein 1 n=1 Tax=Syntrophobotulus glycolicus (strain DSM 8271 / FlGlyR) TaxID=645991 RepID=F0SU32_SYNGF|nr:flagellar hook-associated protein FlgK [Syntrophobotulus glycolicus]ADY55415.1 flagellar hook-associated protein FlgK [Syntrophobotulus glycolicus DSM 8271]